LKEFEATVTDIKLRSQTGTDAIWWMSLSETEFCEGDEGVLEAVTRSGTRLEIAVKFVVAGHEGVLWHVVEKPLAAGTDVRGRVAGQASGSR
jgi:alanyl-tRNA synthetase